MEQQIFPSFTIYFSLKKDVSIFRAIDLHQRSVRGTILVRKSIHISRAQITVFR